MIEDARYEDLGHLVYGCVPEGADVILLYVEFLGHEVVSPSLFYVKDGDLNYIYSDDAIDSELFNLQKLFGPDVKAFEFEIRGGKFFVRFFYADKFDVEADTETRTDAVLRRCFGHTSAKYQSI